MAAIRAMLRSVALGLLRWLDRTEPKAEAPSEPVERRGRKPDNLVVSFCEQFRRHNGRAPSGSEIRAAFPALPVSTAYDYAGRARAGA